MSFNPAEDGVTHINVYSKGATPLGRLLSNFARTPLHLPDGPFASLEGYWYWLGVQAPHGEPLREVSGATAKQLGRTLRERYPAPELPDFQQRITTAMTIKVAQHADLRKQLEQSTLPFAHYYYYGSPTNAKVVDAGFPWITSHWELLRGVLRSV